MTYRVFWPGKYPKPKKEYHPGGFPKRRQARNWCRNHSWRKGLVIEHPDGRTEPYEPKQGV